MQTKVITYAYQPDPRNPNLVIQTHNSKPLKEVLEEKHEPLEKVLMKRPQSAKTMSVEA